MTSPAVDTEACPACGRVQRGRRKHCEMCGEPLGGAVADSPPPALDPAPARFLPTTAQQPERRSRALQFLLVGMPLAALFGLAPLVQFMGWFLGSLFHELGHTLAGWFMGCPAVPAISLTGHAAAVHGEPLWIVRVAVLAGCAALAHATLAGKLRIAAYAALATLYPLLIFTRLGEVLFLTSGHLGELVAACLCLWRAATAEECHHDAERAAYAMVGWYLVARNVALSFGLAFSESTRAEYATNGSFGLTNDYIRLASEHAGTDVGRIGFASGAVVVLAVAATVVLSLRASRA